MIHTAFSQYYNGNWPKFPGPILYLKKGILMCRYCMEFEITEVRPSCGKVSKLLAAVDLNSINSNKPDHVDLNRTWTERLAVSKGSTVCVECQSVALRRTLGGRCRGHGVMAKETRWAAVATGSRSFGCNGKWKLKSRQENCQCDPDSRRSFILV